MNAKEAREIVLAINPIQTEEDYIFANGYLAALEGEEFKQLLKEREAYREVAINILEHGIPRLVLVASEDVDAEAQRILDQEKVKDK